MVDNGVLGPVMFSNKDNKFLFSTVKLSQKEKSCVAAPIHRQF